MSRTFDNQIQPLLDRQVEGNQSLFKESQINLQTDYISKPQGYFSRNTSKFSANTNRQIWILKFRHKGNTADINTAVLEIIPKENTTDIDTKVVMEKESLLLDKLLLF